MPRPFSGQALGKHGSIKYSGYFTRGTISRDELSGGFFGLSRIITQEKSKDDCGRRRHAGAETVSDNEGGEDKAEPANHDLDAVLAGISEEVDRFAAGARKAVMAEFSARMASARRTAPSHEVVFVLRALKAARKSALAVVSLNATLEKAARRMAALATHCQRPRKKQKQKTPKHIEAERY